MMDDMSVSSDGYEDISSGKGSNSDDINDSFVVVVMQQYTRSAIA